MPRPRWKDCWMQALRFTTYGDPDVLEWAEAPEPHAGPGEIRIAVRAASVNPIDWKVFSGKMSGGQPLAGPGYLGYDAAGVVDEVGAGVTGVAVGDRGDPGALRPGRGRAGAGGCRWAGRRGVRRRRQDADRGFDHAGVRAVPGGHDRQLRRRAGRSTGDRWWGGQPPDAGPSRHCRVPGPEQAGDQGTDLPVPPRRRGLPHQ